MEAFKDKMNVTGKVTLKHIDAAGNTISENTVKNLVVDAGLAYIAGRMKETGRPDQMSHMALGASSQTPAAGDTALVSQLSTRVSLTTAGGTVSGNTVTYTASFPAGQSTGAVVEAGIFNASTSGTLLCRTTFPVINKQAGDSLVVTWVVTVS